MFCNGADIGESSGKYILKMYSLGKGREKVGKAKKSKNDTIQLWFKRT